MRGRQCLNIRVGLRENNRLCMLLLREESIVVELKSRPTIRVVSGF